MRFQPELISELKAKAAGSLFMGVPVEELDRDELLACIGAIRQQEEQTDQGWRLDKTMRAFFKKYQYA